MQNNHLASSSPSSGVAVDIDKEQLMQQFEMEKSALQEDYLKQLKDKNIEIKMQKVTIEHLQTCLVALKRGQPFPVPNSANNANGINGSKVYDI